MQPPFGIKHEVYDRREPAIKVETPIHDSIRELVT